MKITLNPHAVPTAEREEKVANCGFGKYYTDHMVVCEWTEAGGWEEPELKPYGPLTLDPATAVFHYGQEIFEGMKAYLFLETVHALVKQDAGWTPGKVGEALYIRPFMIATEVGLGVRPTNKATYLLIATPAGAYFDPSKAVSVWISTEYVRAAQGGTGEAKCGGNYAASLVAQKAAAKEGCDQVVWIDAKERKWIEEMGGMNLYFVKGKGADATVITPKLTGTLLPGITRDSILSVAKDLGYKTEEVMLSIDDWREGVTSGAITEIFACGTAAVVSPVGQAKSAMGTWVTGDGQPGPITMQIRNHLLAIQHGTTADKHGWVKKVSL
jgi:branched-chain amino acid aminotransferase